MRSDRSRIWVALGVLYFIWGSTYLAIRIALESYPPLLLAGVRYLIAGLSLYAWVRLRGAPAPSRIEWRSSALVGTLLVFGNACVVVAEQWVASGVAAIAIGSVPLWVALIAGLFGRWPSKNEWLGLAIGLLGVAFLQTGGDLRASPAGAIVLTVSCVSWAFGSIQSRRQPLPAGAMGSAAQMLAGGAVLTALALAKGERIVAMPSLRATLALAYLIVLGSIVAYTAYQYLLSKVRPTLAASYAYVNPVVAVGLGAALANESVAPRAVGALVLILSGVALLALRRQVA
jgi:drug/metabolite transporter (DMT)-like permease